MGLRTRLQTASLIRKDAGLSAEQRRFAAIVENLLTSEQMDESLSDGHSDEPETWFQSRDEADLSFYSLWENALERYASTRNAGNMVDHNRFTALLNAEPPFANYGYQDMLRARLLNDLTRRRRKLQA